MVAISGAAVSSFGQGLDPADLVPEVTDAVLADAERDADDLDALVVANAAGEAFTEIGNVSVWTATQAGLAGLPTIRVDTGPSSGMAALATARGLASLPSIDDVLVLGWEAMSTVTTSEATAILSGLMAEDERRAGLSLPGLVAMMTRAYLHRYDLAPERLDRIAVKAHALADTNPIAQFGAIEPGDVADSRVIAPPLRLLHCAPLTDGAAALIVSGEGRVDVAAMGAATDPLGYTQRRTPPDRFAATRLAGDRCFAQAGVGRSEVDVVELHDAFASLEAINLEDLGFAEPGKGLHQVPPREDPLASRPAINPSGGLKARGHPIGATGLAQLAECYDQLTARAANQVAGAERALAHSIGGFGNNVHVALLEAAR